MARTSIYTKKLKEALLGGKDKREIGGFVLIRRSNGGIQCLMKETYKIEMMCDKNGKSEKQWKPLRDKIKSDRKELKHFTPAPISDEELSFIE